MGAVGMVNAAALLTFEQTASPVGVVAILIACAFLGVDFMNPPGLFQPLQLAVNCGQPHRLSLPMQLFQQFQSGHMAILVSGDAVEYRPLLPGGIGHGNCLLNLKMIIVFIL